MTTGSGKAYVYSGANSQWTLTATLIGDGGAGSSFGCDVSLDRSGASPFALVGASGDTTSSTCSAVPMLAILPG